MNNIYRVLPHPFISMESDYENSQDTKISSLS